MSHLSNIEGKTMEGKLPVARLAELPLEVVSDYEPAGDQPEAINAIAHNVEAGMRYQTLMGVTGSGKTYTMAKTIEKIQRPTLILAPNKTLAAQLAAELREFFPHNAVVYFVSYYDYYQPELTFLRLTPLLRKMPLSMRKWKAAPCSDSGTSLAS